MAAACAGRRGSAPRRQRPFPPFLPPPPSAGRARSRGPVAGSAGSSSPGASSRSSGASHAGAGSHGVRWGVFFRLPPGQGSRVSELRSDELWTPCCFPAGTLAGWRLVTFMACHGGKAEERKARYLRAARFPSPSRSRFGAPATAAALVATSAPQTTCRRGFRAPTALP